jgi:hypothetical protein
MAIPPPAAALFCRHCQPLSSHSCRCQLLLAFTPPINGWLLRPSLLCHPMPAPLSTAPIIDTFFAGHRAVLFLICAVLFLIAPLPLSTVVIHPATALNLASHCAPIILWCSCPSSILAGCCAASHHAATSCLPAPLPAILLLPLVVCHAWLVRCHLHLSSHHCIPSAWTSTSFYSLPPPPATNFFCPLLSRLIDTLSFVNFGSGQRQVSLTTMMPMATAMMVAMATATAMVAAMVSGTFPQPPPLSPFHYLIVVCLIQALASSHSFPSPTISPLSPRLTCPSLYCPPHPPLPIIYHHHRLIVNYFIISCSPLSSCLSTSFVDGMGFVALLLPPIVFSLSHHLLSNPSVAHHIQPAYYHQLIVILKGGPLLAHCHVSPLFVLMRWASLCLSPLPPSSPSPLTSLTCPFIVGCILPGSQSSTILVDCYFFNCRWSKGNVL